MRVGQARKRDANESAIVDAFRKLGCLVHRVSEKGFPDLIIWHARTGLRLVEVKAPRGTLTPAQVAHRADGWPVQIVRSVDDAIDILRRRTR